jgi:hypothetical protein
MTHRDILLASAIHATRAEHEHELLTLAAAIERASNRRRRRQLARTPLGRVIARLRKAMAE